MFRFSAADDWRSSVAPTGRHRYKCRVDRKSTILPDTHDDRRSSVFRATALALVIARSRGAFHVPWATAVRALAGGHGASKNVDETDGRRLLVVTDRVGVAIAELARSAAAPAADSAAFEYGAGIPETGCDA